MILGTGSFGSGGLVGRPAELAFDILDAYYALGGRTLDTANVYGRWGVEHTNTSEILIGRWLSERGYDDVTVITKACHHAPSLPAVSRVNEKELLRDVEESIFSLGTGKLDVLLLHRDNEELDVREIIDFCTPLVDSGKVKRFGLSNFKTERIRTALDYLGDDRYNYIFGVSNEWSLAMDGAENYRPGDGMVPTDSALKTLKDEYDIPVIPYTSIAFGFFSKLRDCGAVYDGCWQNTEGFRGNRGWLTDKNGEAYNRLLALSEKTGISPAMLSLAYLTSQTNTIPAMSVSRTEQLDELLKVTEGDLTLADFE